jgi:hypothetical protein
MFGTVAEIFKGLAFVFVAAIGLACVGCASSPQVSPIDAASLPEDVVASTPLPGYDGPRLPARPLGFNPLSEYGLLYLGGGDAVDAFPLTGPNQKPVGSITDGINYEWGFGIDDKNTLYVANAGDSTVTVYPYGSSSPSMKYSTAQQLPLYALPDSVGHVFVSGRAEGQGTVTEYAIGNNAPIAQAKVGYEADGLAEDGQGDLFVAYREHRRASIAEFGPGLKDKRQALGAVLDQPQGLLVDRAGNIVVVESQAKRIDVFPPGASRPSVSLTISGIGNLAELAMQDHESTLWVSSEEGYVYSMPYPLTASTIPTQYDVVGSNGNGVAVTR